MYDGEGTVIEPRSVIVLLQERKAAHAARSMYQRAAERHAEHALREQDHGHRANARYLARLSLLLQKEGQYQ